MVASVVTHTRKKLECIALTVISMCVQRTALKHTRLASLKELTFLHQISPDPLMVRSDVFVEPPHKLKQKTLSSWVTYMIQNWKLKTGAEVKQHVARQT